MLRPFFNSQGYEVDLAMRGSEAPEKTRQGLLHLLVLDIMLPDIDGYEVCRALRTNTRRVSHIPILFLTQKDERSDKLKGLELGADDCTIKPFDIEEPKLRVQNALAHAERESLTDPQSGLPSGCLIEDQLRRVIRQSDWAFMDICINHFDAFRDAYGLIAANNVLRFTAMLLSEVVDELGTPSDFIGHAGGDNFVIFTSSQAAPRLKERLKARFAEAVLSHYNFMDRQQGYILTPGPGGEMIQTPFVSLAIGYVTPSMQPFTDIREITEVAAEERRRDATTCQG